MLPACISENRLIIVVLYVILLYVFDKTVVMSCMHNAHDYATLPELAEIEARLDAIYCIRWQLLPAGLT